MKNRILWSLGLSLAIVFLPLASGCARQASQPPITLVSPEAAPEVAVQPSGPAEPPPAEPAPAPASSAPAQPGSAASADDPAPPDLANARATPVSDESPAPPNVRTVGPVADLIKLASSGVDQGVLLAYATNSASLFNLNAEEIIYMKDLGIPSAVVTAILQHDQALKEGGAGSNPNPPPALAVQQFAPQAVAPPPAPAVVSAPPPAVPAGPPPEAQPPLAPEPVDATFYDALAPYGTWVQVEGVGLCWRPSVEVTDPSWQPYYDEGHWIYTDCGWYWASGYSWGWAPFHYGRWFRHNRWGWCWAPDTVWGPSWVCWRYNDGYCGWAPLPPGAWFRPGIGLTFYGRGVSLGFNFGLGFDSFAFVPWGHFHEHHLRPWGLGRDRIARIYRQTTPVTRYQGAGRFLSNSGLSPSHVASVTHTQVQPVAIREVKGPVTPGVRADRLAPNGRTLNVFRPTPPATSRLSSPHTVGLATAQRPSAATTPQFENPSPWLAPRTASPAPATGQGRQIYAPSQQPPRQPAPAPQYNYNSRATYQAPAEVPRYSSPHAYSAPVPREAPAAPAPARSAAPPPPPPPPPPAAPSRSDRGGR